MNENNIKALFPEGVETITISKNDYDRLYGQLTYENMILQSKIDKANELLQDILVVSDWEHKGKYRPVKNTSSQDVYKAICKLYGILETPYRSDYGALKEDK